MKMNDEVYEGTKALNTSESSLVKFEQISITTVLEEHIYNRKIKLDISEKNFDRTAHILEQRCKGFSGTFEKGYSDCTITFETDSEKEMIKNTMLLLGTSVNITYEKYSAGKNMVRIEAVERIDVKEILEEEGNFRYEFTVPETYQNLTPDLEVETTEKQDENPEKVYISQNVISYYGVEGEIRYYYDAPLKFDKVSVSTDISNELRRIKRTITFYRDWNIADNYHKSTTKQFQKKLKRGETLRIYDEKGYRCYEVSYSSWFTSRINRFTDKMFGINHSKLEVKRRAVPFIESKVKDQFNLEKGNVESYTEQIDSEYIVPGNTILVDGDWNYSKEIRFLSFFYRKCILYAMGVLIVILCIWRGICVIQKKKQKANTSVMRARYCPRCGRERKGGESFCQKCGYKF